VNDSREFEHRIATLDCGLFDLVETQSTEKDRRSWLALQRAVRDSKAPFVYLEIGSYLGGSLQQYLADPHCSRIYSIDNRTLDERHAGNCAEAMLANLRPVAPDELHKLVCFDASAGDLPADAIVEAPDICFIDGEHTTAGVLSDFAFCLGVCAPGATIAFHDAGCTREGIAECLHRLRDSGRSYAAYKLPGDTFVVALEGSPAGVDSRLRDMAVALNGERWLRTAAVAKRARRWAPAALRPALARARNRWWGAGR
jgi:hypothetical protein